MTPKQAPAPPIAYDGVNLADLDPEDLEARYFEGDWTTRKSFGLKDDHGFIDRYEPGHRVPADAAVRLPIETQAKILYRLDDEEIPDTPGPKVTGALDPNAPPPELVDDGTDFTAGTGDDPRLDGAPKVRAGMSAQLTWVREVDDPGVVAERAEAVYERELRQGTHARQTLLASLDEIINNGA